MGFSDLKTDMYKTLGDTVAKTYSKDGTATAGKIVQLLNNGKIKDLPVKTLDGMTNLLFNNVLNTTAGPDNGAYDAVPLADGRFVLFYRPVGVANKVNVQTVTKDSTGNYIPVGQKFVLTVGSSISYVKGVEISDGNIYVTACYSNGSALDLHLVLNVTASGTITQKVAGSTIYSGQLNARDGLLPLKIGTNKVLVISAGTTANVSAVIVTYNGSTALTTSSALALDSNIAPGFGNAAAIEISPGYIFVIWGTQTSGTEGGTYGIVNVTGANPTLLGSTVRLITAKTLGMSIAKITEGKLVLFYGKWSGSYYQDYICTINYTGTTITSTGTPYRLLNLNYINYSSMVVIDSNKVAIQASIGSVYYGDFFTVNVNGDVLTKVDEFTTISDGSASFSTLALRDGEYVSLYAFGTTDVIAARYSLDATGKITKLGNFAQYTPTNGTDTGYCKSFEMDDGTIYTVYSANGQLNIAKSTVDADDNVTTDWAYMQNIVSITAVYYQSNFAVKVRNNIIVLMYCVTNVMYLKAINVATKTSGTAVQPTNNTSYCADAIQVNENTFLFVTGQMGATSPHFNTFQVADDLTVTLGTDTTYTADASVRWNIRLGLIEQNKVLCLCENAAIGKLDFMVIETKNDNTIAIYGDSSGVAIPVNNTANSTIDTSGYNRLGLIMLTKDTFLYAHKRKNGSAPGELALTIQVIKIARTLANVYSIPSVPVATTYLLNDGTTTDITYIQSNIIKLNDMYIIPVIYKGYNQLVGIKLSDNFDAVTDMVMFKISTKMALPNGIVSIGKRFILEGGFGFAKYTRVLKISNKGTVYGKRLGILQYDGKTVISKGLSTKHSNLIPGASYYVDNNGNLTATGTQGDYVGVALSTTELYIPNNIIK